MFFAGQPVLSLPVSGRERIFHTVPFYPPTARKKSIRASIENSAQVEVSHAMLTHPLKHHAAGHFNSLSIDPPILVREKRRDHGSDIVRHTRTSQRSHFRNALIDLGIVAYHAAAEVGLDCARSNDIRGDPARAEFFGQIASQNLDRSLGGSICGTAGQSNARESDETFTMRPPSFIKGRSFCVRK